MPLPLLSLLEEGRNQMPAVEGLVRHKRVTLGEPGVRSFTFLQNNYCVPRVAVRKVNPEVGLIRGPSQAPLHWAPDPQQTFQERDQVRDIYTLKSVMYLDW